MINFQIKSSEYKNMYIINMDVGKSIVHDQELDKIGDDYFSGDAYIFTPKVYIMTKIIITIMIKL